MLNHAEVMGRLTENPELRSTASGTSVVSFTLASDTGRKRDDGSRITDFIDCVAWRQTAEFVARYLTKGRLVVVEGRLSPRKYEDKTGAKHKVTEISVENVHFADSRKDDGSEAAGNYDQRSTADNFTEIDDEGDLPF